MRKDLSLSSAVALQQRMMEARGTDDVQWTTSPGQPAHEAIDTDVSRLEADTVGRILIEDGVFGSAITTLAQLRRWTSARTEIAFLSRARTYTRNCAQSDQRWTSAIHLWHWTRDQLDAPVHLAVADFRAAAPCGIREQEELGAWSIVMLRLTLLDDIADAARSAREDDFAA
ncbi:MAG: hypothetical protein KC492_01805, partial [Myxococcales bacterium]|nr:hypothetical protein [Myxococcales bacterium]